MGRDDKHYKSEVKIKRRVDSSRKQMLLGNVTRIPWITAITSLVPQFVVQIANFQLRCTANANFVAKMPKNVFLHFGGQV